MSDQRPIFRYALATHSLRAGGPGGWAAVVQQGTAEPREWAVHACCAAPTELEAQALGFVRTLTGMQRDAQAHRQSTGPLWERAVVLARWAATQPLQPLALRSDGS